MSGLLGGVLPAIFSQADRAKRYIGGLLADPVGRMQQAGGQAVDDLSKLGLLSEQAFNDPRNPMKLQDNAAARQLTDTYLNSVLNFAPVGMFVGPKSATWDKAAADKAQALAQKGVDPRQIWKETGTFKGPDGAWRQEIPDNKMSVLRQFKTDAADDAINLDDAIKHSDLFAAYPDARTIGARHKNLQSGTFGGYSEGADTVVVNSGSNYFKDKDLLKGGMAHEIQHAIQQREGWAKGGSPNDAALLPYVRKFYADNIDKFDGESHQLVNMAKNRAYQNLSGEAEARAVQARMNMNMQQRRELFPLDSYDVPLDQLILRR